ncbi:endonuclease/exonuclease/phosphatase family protein [uncultured Roseobacter sp.]|uniref:endonuclease/exonuclease/phosphatase family protein n=1 Tax=uncultured Roseobacter sp. TaxID=114847 RepID=UPI00263492B0|nr:endonuclease/exonuclease/phosphatase family protein [uncultured Roseobacter sp.]
MAFGLSLIFWLLVAAVLFTTAAPLTHSVQWWVRGWDFPRVHIAGVALLAAALGIWLGGHAAQLAAVVLVGCALYQTYRILPYTPLVQPELTLVPGTPDAQQASILSVNVLMENTDHHRLRALIDREAPDVLFLMETDQAWVDAVEEQLARYETVLRHPLPNYYGAVFATNLPVTRAEMVFLSDDDTPAVLAQLTAPTGDFFFVGLHPKPPVPGTDTEERDAQIKRAAQLADRTLLPVVAMGDFNDVAWSRTSERFKDYGDFRDPRIGRGLLPSFDANSWIMRFPIDQLYLTKGVELVSFGRLEHVGSDHFPMKAVITVTGLDP